jgi:ligand-binding sensor domain-containing protein
MNLIRKLSGKLKKKTLFYTLFILLICGGIAIAQQWVNYTKENSGLADNQVRAICVENNNVKWFGTRNGLTRFDGKTWTTYTTGDSLAHNSVNSIAYEETQWGPEIWVATDSGVSVISVVPDAITFATPYRKDNTGLISNTVRAVAIDEYHIKWFGTDAGVSSFDGSVWASFTVEQNNYLKSNNILSIHPVKDFVTYFGTAGGGVSRFDSITQATPLITRDYQLASDTVFSIYASKKGNEWFGTDAGLSHHTSEWPEIGWETYTTADGLADNVVLSIMAETDSILWIGTNKGLNRFDGTQWTTYTKNDGLVGTTVFALARDGNGSIWLGTDSGVSHYTPSGTSVEKNDTEPCMLSIEGVYPNPFNLKTSISFTVPVDGVIELGIYNLVGQRIRRLVSSWTRSGSQQIVWDGYDSAGICVSSGIYIARLSMGRYVATTKLTVIK